MNKPVLNYARPRPQRREPFRLSDSPLGLNSAVAALLALLIQAFARNGAFAHATDFSRLAAPALAFILPAVGMGCGMIALGSFRENKVIAASGVFLSLLQIITMADFIISKPS